MKMLDRQRQIQAVMESGGELSQYAYVNTVSVAEGRVQKVDIRRAEIQPPLFWQRQLCFHKNIGED